MSFTLHPDNSIALVETESGSTLPLITLDPSFTDASNDAVRNMINQLVYKAVTGQASHSADDARTRLEQAQVSVSKETALNTEHLQLNGLTKQTIVPYQDEGVYQLGFVQTPTVQICEINDPEYSLLSKIAIPFYDNDSEGNLD